MTVVAFLLILGLCTRLTRLLVDDGITQPFRDWLARASDTGAQIVTTVDRDPINNRISTTTQRYVENPKKARHVVLQWLWELFQCPWCVSVHVVFWALLVAETTSQIDLNWFWFGATWGSMAWLVGLASTLIGVLHGAEKLEAEAVR